MKNSSSVRKPALANSNLKNDDEIVPIGTVLRRAKRNLFFKRCLSGILIVLVVTVVLFLAIMGYTDLLLDKFYSLLG